MVKYITNIRHDISKKKYIFSTPIELSLDIKGIFKIKITVLY